MTTPRMLIVDDDPCTRKALCTLFARKGWEVATAGTIADGLAGLDSHPQCVILDLNLPDGGGETILGEIRRNHPETRVAVCSASTDDRQLNVVRELSPELMLCKPIDMAPLDRMCDALMLA